MEEARDQHARARKAHVSPEEKAVAEALERANAAIQRACRLIKEEAERRAMSRPGAN